MTLTQLRDQIATSIFGRRLGLDTNDFLLGPRGIRNPLVAATSATTATVIPNHGFVSVVTTTDDGWLVAAPVAGCKLHIFSGSSSTGIHTLSFASTAVACGSNVTVLTTAGSAGTTGRFLERGGFFTLVGMSTAQWALVGRSIITSADLSS